MFRLVLPEDSLSPHSSGFGAGKSALETVISASRTLKPAPWALISTRLTVTVASWAFIAARWAFMAAGGALMAAGGPLTL